MFHVMTKMMPFTSREDTTVKEDPGHVDQPNKASHELKSCDSLQEMDMPSRSIKLSKEEDHAQAREDDPNPALAHSFSAYSQPDRTTLHEMVSFINHSMRGSS